MEPVSDFISKNFNSIDSYDFYNYIPVKYIPKADSWVLWILIILVILFILWLFFGGGDYEYIGLSPLKIGVDSTKYANDHTFAEIGKSNRRATKYVCDQETSGFSKLDIERALGPYKEFKSSKVSKGEQACKKAIEEIYNKPFYCVRPNFLKNPDTKRNLELDMYNHELKIGVEYSGIQHYKWPNFTGQSREKFIEQVRRDKFKIDCCDNNGVYLITVPYTVKESEIKDYIIYNLPENYQARMERGDYTDYFTAKALNNPDICEFENDDGSDDYDLSDESYDYENCEVSFVSNDYSNDYSNEHTYEYSDD